MSQTITPPTVVSQAAPPPLVVTRIFAAPRERVFKAWTDPNQLSRWFGPSDEYTAKAEIDLRVGGAYRLEMHHSGGNVHTVVGTYREIIPPEKLSFTWQWEGSPAPDTLVTIDFVCRRQLHRDHHDPPEVRRYRDPRQTQRRLGRRLQQTRTLPRVGGVTRPHISAPHQHQISQGEIMPNPFCHIELNTTNLPAAKTFY